jgi:hypothetical protein
MSQAAKAQSLFIPDLWSTKILDAFSDSSAFAPNALDPRTIWNNPRGGEETYEEAVAWARLLGVSVTKNTRVKGAEMFVLSTPGDSGPGHIHVRSMTSAYISTNVPAMIPICSPAVLIQAIKEYANQTP